MKQRVSKALVDNGFIPIQSGLFTGIESVISHATPLLHKGMLLV